MPKEKRETVTIKVSKDTYNELVKSRAMAELQTGRRFSMDEVVKGLLEQAKEYRFQVQKSPKAP